MKRLLFLITLIFFGTLLAHGSFAATNVYYSVGQNSTDNKTCTAGDCGTNPLTVTITSGAAVFSVAQTGNIGVGDRVTYNTNVVAYIAAKTNADQTHWTLVTALGANPADISGSAVVSIAHEYTSLSAAVAGASDVSHINNASLVAADKILNIPCYYDTGADTTAVTVSGYTTDATRYIKIYTPNNTATESNLSQRHDGKWDETRYNLRAALSNTGVMELHVTNIIVDGVQIEAQGTGNYHAPGIQLASAPLSGFVNIENSIVRANIDKTKTLNSLIGINIYNNAGPIVKIWNNIVYGFSRNSGGGVGIRSNYPTSYVYGNTVYDSNYGITSSSSNIILAKNNLIKSCAISASGTFSTGTDYNATDNASMGYTVTGAGNTHDRVSQSFRFLDEANKDFHLHFLDTAALGQGANLTADANLPITADIDGQTIPTLSHYDIGADVATTAIYRSVGSGATNAVTTGANNGVDIAGSLATFNAPLPDNVGVGDVIQYDSDNNGSIDSLAFIYERIDSSHYVIKKSDGTVPTATVFTDADWAIYRAYTSLSNAESGIENSGVNSTYRNFDDWTAGGTAATDDVGKNLVTANQQWNIAAYANGTTADAIAVTVDGWTTAANNYIKIYTPTALSEVGISQRHSGKWDTSKYYIQATLSNSTLVYIKESFVRVDGLQISPSCTTNGAWSRGVNVYNLDSGSSDIRISNNIISQGMSNNGDVQGLIISNTNATARVWNNVIYGFVQGIARGVENTSSRSSYYYNNTCYNNRVCMNAVAGNVIAKNNIAVKGGGLVAMSGTFAAGTDYNATDQASMNYTVTGAGNSHDRLSQSFSLINTTAGSEDFHLANADAAAKNVGVDLSADSYLSVTTDIDGQSRMSGTAYDIGADERLNNVYYSVSGGGSTADMKTAATVQVSNGVMIFSVAQAGNIGVGDEIIYDADNKKAYISGKIDTTHWSVVDKLGDKPADAVALTTLTSIKRVWGSLSAAIAGSSGANYVNTTNLQTAGVTLNLPCYYDTGADTTAITVSGYTTGVNNYIKIYTPSDVNKEANNSQRHSGKWEDSKYNIVTSGTSLNVSTNNTIVQGLQVYNNGISNYPFSYSNDNEVVNTSLDVSSNILRGGNFTMFISRNAQVVRIYNNLMYDSADTTLYYYRTENISNAYILIANNTLYNSGNKGIYITGGYTKLVNNLISNSVRDCYGIGFVTTLLSGSNSNISSDATSPNSGSTDCGGHSCRNQTVQFADVANKDFHLAYVDTAARNAGTDLSYDVNLPVTTDADGNTRYSDVGRARYFDIGADQGATAIYRSIAPGATSDLNTSTRTVTIANSTATFSDAMPDNVGVGDVLQYDPDGAGAGGYYLAFITGRTSSTVFVVKNSSGGVPTAAAAGTAVKVFRAYISLADAASSVSGGTENTGIDSTVRNFDGWRYGKNLMIANQQWNIAAYANGTTGESLAATMYINNWITGAADYLKVYTPYLTSEVGVSQRHSGKLDQNKYYINVTSSNQYTTINISNGSNYFRAEGLQITKNGTAANATALSVASTIPNGQIYLSNNLIAYQTGSRFDNGIIDNGSATVFAYNNVIQQVAVTGIRLSCTAGRLYAYSNTIYDVSARGIDNYVAGGILVAKNNIVQNATNGDYAGVFTTSDYNISSDSTNTGGAHDKVSATVSFADAANGDLHLSPNDTAAKNQGVKLLTYSDDPNLNFSTDIDSEARSGTWSIGADEPFGAKSQGSHAVNTHVNVDTGLVGYWSFDGSDINGTTAIDKSGNNNNGTISGATSTLGKRGQALSFNGSSNYVEKISPTNIPATNSPISISLWAKSNVSSGGGVLFDIYGTNLNNITLRLNPYGGKTRFAVAKYGDSALAQTSISSPDNTFYANQWIQYVYTFDGTNHIIYRNGQLDAASTTVPDSGSISKLGIGRREVGTAGFFNGSIDEVRIYNRALTPAEISDLYRLGQNTIRQGAGTATIKK